MEEAPKYEVGKKYYPTGTPWPMPGDSIQVGQVPPVVPVRQNPEQFDIINKLCKYNILSNLCYLEQ